MVYTWHDRATTRGDGGVGVGQVERSSAGGRTRVSIVVGAWRSSEARFGSLVLKTTKAAGFLVWASKPRFGGLARLSGPWTCRGTCRSRFRWFGPQNHQGGGFPGFGLKTGGGVWRCLGRREGCVDGSRTLRGVEARCAKYSRPSDRKRNENGRKRPCVGCLVQIGEGLLWKITT